MTILNCSRKRPIKFQRSSPITTNTASSCLNIIYQNVRGLNTKISAFYVNSCVADSDVVILTETWLTPNIASSELFSTMYDVFRCDRKTGRGGGVLIAVKKCFFVEELNLSSPVPEIELLGIKLLHGSRHVMVLVAVYVPPSIQLNTYLRLLEYLEESVDYSRPVIITGDFNIPEFADCTAGLRSTNLFNNVKHFMSLNTLNQNSSVLNVNDRLLDLVLSTNRLVVDVQKHDQPLVPEDLHHPSLEILLHCDNSESVPFLSLNDTSKFDFRKANLNDLYLSLSMMDWSSVDGLLSVESACDEIYRIIFHQLETYVPKRKKKSRQSNYPIWFTKAIIDKIAVKNKYWNLYRKNNKPLYLLQKVKALRSEIKREARNEYRKFIVNTENSVTSEPRKFWSFVRSKNKSTSIPGRMVHDNVMMSDPQEIVNSFAQHFSEVFNNNCDHVCDSTCCQKSSVKCINCAKYCCLSGCDVRIYDNVETLYKFNISESDILTAVKRMKGNFVAGPDNIPAFLIVDCIQCFLKPLCHLFNLIIKSCTYPERWKLSRVCPVFKAGDRSDITNYRPIAILSNFSKLFECIVSDMLYAHMISSIAPEQHGFVRGRSTATNLCEFTQFVSGALDDQLQVDAIYTDLTKAFDKVDHCILLYKLSKFGLCEDLLILLKSMIVGRKQIVEYNGFLSYVYQANSGVTQGSNLGPPLFILFYNDVVSSVRSRVFIYADDLKIARIIKSSYDCLELQDDLEKIVSWCNKNKLQLNNSKCKILSFSRKIADIDFHYNINGTVLIRCSEIKDLGIILDKSLTFLPHIEHLTCNAMKILGMIIRNTADFSNINCIKLLFYCLVRSKFEYCCLVWMPYHQNYINLIEGVLRKFAKYVHFKMFRCYPERHCDQSTLLKRVDEVPLCARMKVACNIFLQKLVNGNIHCTKLLDQVLLQVPRLNSRRPYSFTFVIPNTVHHFNSPLIRCFRLYNDIRDLSYDIFGVNFNTRHIKEQLANLYV